jgi:hypothetical protein
VEGGGGLLLYTGLSDFLHANNIIEKENINIRIFIFLILNYNVQYETPDVYYKFGGSY